MDEPDTTKEDREQLVVNLVKPTHRWIICVEACRDWSKMEMIQFAKKVDPELTRTALVYTKFQTMLQSFTSTREVNKYLSGNHQDL